jgi:hypothetical protein
MMTGNCADILRGSLDYVDYQRTVMTLLFYNLNDIHFS